jgi:hypothetical protein
MLTIKNKHYTDLYNKVLNCPDFNQVQEVGIYNPTLIYDGPGNADVVDICHILTIHVEKRIYPDETTGGSDDYGNRERIGLTTCKVTVINFWASDINNEIVPSDFDPEAFEIMFE